MNAEFRLFQKRNINDLNTDFTLLSFNRKKFKNFTRIVFAPVTEANRGVLHYVTFSKKSDLRYVIFFCDFNVDIRTN